MIRKEDVYKIGKIGRPHGIKGEVIFMFSDDVFDQTDAEYIILLIDGILVPFFMEEYRFKSGETAILKLEDIDSVEKAQTITNCEVFFPRQLAEEEEHYSWSQLAGYSIVSANINVGIIQDIDTSTENYLFVVSSAKDSEEILIPAADEWIEDINHSERVIYMQLPEGLI